MNIKWSRQALHERERIVFYLFYKFGKVSAHHFENEMYGWEQRLSMNPEIGSFEYLLRNRRKVYRSVVVNKYTKLIYYTDKTTVYIADLWDTRCEPTRLSGRLSR